MSKLYQEFLATCKRIGLDLEVAAQQHSLDLYKTLSEPGKILTEVSILDYLEQKNYADWKMSAFKEFAKSVYDWIDYLGKQNSSTSSVYEFASGETVTVVNSPGLVKLCIRMFDLESEDFVELHEEFTPTQLGKEELSDWSSLRSGLLRLLQDSSDREGELFQKLHDLEKELSVKSSLLEECQDQIEQLTLDHESELRELAEQVDDLEEEVARDDQRHAELSNKLSSVDRKLKKSIEVANALEVSYLQNLKNLKEEKQKNQELSLSLFKLTEEESILREDLGDLTVRFQQSQEQNHLLHNSHLQTLQSRDLQHQELVSKLNESTNVAQLMKDMYEHTQEQRDQAEELSKSLQGKIEELTTEVQELRGANEKIQLDIEFTDSVNDSLGLTIEDVADRNFELEQQVAELKSQLSVAQAREFKALDQLAEVRKELYSKDIELHHTRRVLKHSAWRRTVKRKSAKLGLDSVYKKTFMEKEVGVSDSKSTPSIFPGKEVAGKLSPSVSDSQLIHQSEEPASLVKISNRNYDPRLSGLLLKSVMSVLTKVLDAKEADEDPKMDLSLEGSEKEVVERYRNRWRFLLSCINRSSNEFKN